MIGGNARKICREAGKACAAAVREHCVNGQHVVAHGAEAQRTATAGVVGGHAADRGARRRRDIDGKPETVLLQLPVEVVQDDAGLNRTRASCDIEVQNTCEVLGAIDDETRIDGLAALRGAAAPRGDGNTLINSDRNGVPRLRDGARTATAAGIIW